MPSLDTHRRSKAPGDLSERANDKHDDSKSAPTGGF
jgi:hypothetical protein